jgi:hypothetical protein
MGERAAETITASGITAPEAFAVGWVGLLGKLPVRTRAVTVMEV